MLFLAVQNLVLDVGQIVIFNILFENLADVWEFILVHKLNPVGASDTVSLALGVGFVTEYGSFVECTVKSSNNSALSVSNNILLLLIDLVTDITLTSFDENNLVDLIQLLEQNSSSILLSWL